MSVQVTYPGVYVQEQSSGVRTITGVSTSVALFVGMAQRGPMDTAVNVLSFAGYERVFGADTTVSETTEQVRQFFINGGRQAHVIRIAANEQAASADLSNESGAVVLRLTAVEAGRIGESIRVEVSYATAQPESTFSLIVSRETVDATGNRVLVETETLADLSMNANDARFVETAVEQASMEARERGRVGALRRRRTGCPCSAGTGRGGPRRGRHRRASASSDRIWPRPTASPPLSAPLHRPPPPTR